MELNDQHRLRLELQQPVRTEQCANLPALDIHDQAARVAVVESQEAIKREHRNLDACRLAKERVGTSWSAHGIGAGQVEVGHAGMFSDGDWGDSNPVGIPVERDIAPEEERRMWIRLEGHDPASRADAGTHLKNVHADACANVPGLVTGAEGCAKQLRCGRVVSLGEREPSPRVHTNVRTVHPSPHATAACHQREGDFTSGPEDCPEQGLDRVRQTSCQPYVSLDSTSVPAAESMPPMPLTRETLQLGTWRGPHSPRSWRAASMMGKMPYMPECV
jgi:hypothetical protein